MAKYNEEQKMQVVRGVLEKHMSYSAAAKMIGANKVDAQKWVRQYEEHGIEGLLIKKGSYDGDFKIAVVEYMHANHLSVMDTAAKFGIPGYSTVWQWERIYYEEGREALFRNNRGRKGMSRKRTVEKPELGKKVEEDLLAENQRLKMENAYLKKLQALVQERIRRESGKK